MGLISKVGDLFGVGGFSDLIQEVIKRVAPDQEKAAEMAFKYKELEQKGEIEIMANELGTLKALLEDTKSAREREISVANGEHVPLINKIITPILASSCILLSFILFFLLIFDNTLIDPSRKDVIIYILGVLSAIDVQITQYYFGSTQNSKSRTDSILNLMKK